MKIFNGVARFLFSTMYDIYQLRYILRYYPMLYGVWHAFKSCSEAICKKFFSLCTFLSSGPQAHDAAVYTHPKLIWKVCMFMSLLLAANKYLQQQKTKLRDLSNIPIHKNQ